MSTTICKLNYKNTFDKINTISNNSIYKTKETDMAEELTPTPRKKRPRIGQTPAPAAPRTTFSNREQAPTERRRIFTRNDSDFKRNAPDKTDLLHELLISPERCYERKYSSVLQDVISPWDKRQLISGDFSGLAKKYKAALRRKYVYLMAQKDVKNYCSGAPKQLTRDDDIRLETMEQLRRLKEDNKITEKQFNEIHQRFFSDIKAKDSLPSAQVTKMLRCMAAGKFYAPVKKDGTLNEQALSPTYRVILKSKKRISGYKPEDYDIFGCNQDGSPLSPAFHAVKGSENFQRMKKSILGKMSELGISPEEACQLNSADIAHMMQKPGELRDIPFTEICPDVKDSPYQEFAQKLGMILTIGNPANRVSGSKYWLKHFASPQEKMDYDEGDKIGYQLFLNSAERIYEKLKKDCSQNGMDSDFVEKWAQSMIENKSVNVNLVPNCKNKPFKVDIHHWERLSAAAEDASPADKNNLENFGLMIMYHENDMDVHADKHKGESAHYVMASFEERQEKFPTKHLICSSDCLVISSELLKGRSDISKIETLQKKIKPEPKKVAAGGYTPQYVVAAKREI